MALFSKKEQSKVPARVEAVAAGYAHVLKHARITEKATMLSAGNVYTFDIASQATKRDVIGAVRAIYGVVPAKVTVVKKPTKARRSMRTGIIGKTGGGKKAYVYLKKGDTITLG